MTNQISSFIAEIQKRLQTNEKLVWEDEEKQGEAAIDALVQTEDLLSRILTFFQEETSFEETPDWLKDLLDTDEDEASE